MREPLLSNPVAANGTKNDGLVKSSRGAEVDVLERRMEAQFHELLEPTKAPVLTLGGLTFEEQASRSSKERDCTSGTPSSCSAKAWAMPVSLSPLSRSSVGSMRTGQSFRANFDPLREAVGTIRHPHHHTCSLIDHPGCFTILNRIWAAWWARSWYAPT